MKVKQRVRFRSRVREEDLSEVSRMVTSSGFFSADETSMALDLVKEALSKGEEASGYHFLFAEIKGIPMGYACFGPIPCTRCGYDLYWLVVHQDYRGCGLGRRLLKVTERLAWSRGGCRIYVETSSREQYAPTRAFYEACGYTRVATLLDFYAPRDGKVIYEKVAGVIN